MRLTKFPVISPSGAEYRVVVDEYTWSVWTWDRVKVYVKGRGWLRWMRLCVWTEELRRDRDTIPIVDLVKRAIEKYENHVAHETEKRRKQADNERQFREWDGDMRNSHESQ